MPSKVKIDEWGFIIEIPKKRILDEPKKKNEKQKTKTKK
jgi:hypothetical protein